MIDGVQWWGYFAVSFLFILGGLAAVGVAALVVNLFEWWERIRYQRKIHAPSKTAMKDDE